MLLCRSLILKSVSWVCEMEQMLYEAPMEAYLGQAAMHICCCY